MYVYIYILSCYYLSSGGDRPDQTPPASHEEWNGMKPIVGDTPDQTHRQAAGNGKE